MITVVSVLRLEREGPRSLRVLPFYSIVGVRKSMHRNRAQEYLRSASASRVRCLQARIPYNSLVEQMGVHRAPLAVFAARSLAAYANRALRDEIQAQLDASSRT